MSRKSSTTPNSTSKSLEASSYNAASAEEPITELIATTRSRWQLALVAGVPLLAIYAAGSRPAWALASIAALMTVCMLLMPPRARISVYFWILPVLMLLFALGFALPVSSLQEWRTELLRDLQIDTGSLHSPQPWISLERWMLIALVLLWMFFCMARSFSDGERRVILQVLVIGLTVIAASAIWLRLRGIEPPAPWVRDDSKSFDFGPFPNRNHFSGMCAVTGILAFVGAYDSFRRGKFGWLLFSGCLAVAFAALMLNTSRFGVVMFFLGCGSWMLCATLRSQSAKKMAVFSSLFLFGTTFLLIFGQRILQRFTNGGNLLDAITGSNRIVLYSDSLRLIPDSPWFGWGLGTFEQVYALLGRYGDTFYRASHPENDLFWFTLESGIPATLCLLAGFMVLILHFGPWRTIQEKYGRRDRRLRQAAAIAALMLAAQSLIDVPLHSIGVAVLGATLAGLGYNTQRLQHTVSRRLWLHLPAALFCLSGALIWYTVARGTPLFPTDTHARKRLVEASHLIEQNRHAEALQATEEALRIRPLHWDVYFRRAILKLNLGFSPQQVLVDFARARRLEPTIVSIATREAEIWTVHHPPFAMAAYREAIRRDPSAAQQNFRHALHVAQQHPDLRPTARAMALTDPKLHLIFILHCDGQEFVNELQELLKRQPDLKVYNREERLQLFQHWHSKADRGALLKQLENKPQWLADGWSVLATNYAQQGNFRRACRIAFDQLPEPFETQAPSNTDIDQLTRRFLLNPTDITRGLQLYEIQKISGRHEDALKTLNEIAALPSAPDKIHYERALILNQLGEYSKAWSELQAYMTNIGD